MFPSFPHGANAEAKLKVTIIMEVTAKACVFCILFIYIQYIYFDRFFFSRIEFCIEVIFKKVNIRTYMHTHFKTRCT
jgi:hypothetical protein